VLEVVVSDEGGSWWGGVSDVAGSGAGADDAVPENEFRIGIGFGFCSGLDCGDSRPTAMASGWRGFGFVVEYFEQFAGLLDWYWDAGVGQGLGLEGRPIWVMGESESPKGFSLIRE